MVVGQIFALFLQIDILGKHLLHLLLFHLDWGKRFSGRKVKPGNPILQFIDLVEQLFVEAAVLLDRSLQVLSLLLHFSAQLCYGCIVSVHSLLLLPQVVLHGRHLLLHLPAILNLLQDAPLLLPTTPNLCVEFCYLLGMV